jgi:hypothetical protein
MERKRKKKVRLCETRDGETTGTLTAVGADEKEEGRERKVIRGI